MEKNKRRTLVRVVLVFLISLSIQSCCTRKNKNTDATATSSALLQVCPDEWIQNKMPGTDTQETREYFILDGKRRELKEFDLSWIKKNCDTKPQIVQ